LIQPVLGSTGIFFSNEVTSSPAQLTADHADSADLFLRDPSHPRHLRLIALRIKAPSCHPWVRSSRQ